MNLIAVGAGILNAGSILFTNGGGGVRHEITISTGTVTVTGDITTDNSGASASIIFSGAGTLNAGVGILTTTTAGGTLTTVAGSTVNYNGTGAQVVKDVNYTGNLIFSGTGTKTWTLTTAKTVGGAITIGTGAGLTTAGNYTLGVTGASNITGTLTLGGTSAKTFTGDVTLNTGSVWNETVAAALNFAGNLVNNATTFTANTGTHTFTGSGKALSGSTTIAIPTVTFTGNYSNNGTLTAATLLTVTGAAITLTNNSTITATTSLAGTGIVSNSGTLNIGGACSITTLTNSGTTAISGSGTISTVLANFTNTGTINISGSGTIVGIMNNAGGIVNHSGSSTITSFNNATSTSTLNISTTPTVPTFTTLTVSVAGNTVNYNGTGAQTIKAIAYSNLSLSGTGIKTLTGLTTINKNFSLSGTASATLTANTAIAGDLNIGTGAQLDLSGFTANRGSAGGTLTVAGTLLLGGTTGGQTGSNFPTGYTTLTLTGGTINYDNSTGSQTIYSTPAYATLAMGNTSGTQTAGGAISASALNTTAGGTLNMGTYALSGLTTVAHAGILRTQNTTSTPFTGGLTWGGTVTFDGSSAQTIPSTASSFNNLTISNTAGVTAAADQTVTGALSLTTNPNSTTGSLNMSTYTLEMGVTGTTTGTGDVMGIVKRTGTFSGSVAYSFGNAYTTVSFVNFGTKPNWLSCKIVLGSALPGKSGAVLRYYSFAQNALATYTDKVVLRLHYLGAELNANTEANLVLWDSDASNGEHGRSNIDNTSKWVELTGISVNYLAPSVTQPNATRTWGLAQSGTVKNTWSGATDSQWDVATNWTGGHAPLATDSVLIANLGGGTPNYPTLTSDAVAKTLEIQSGASLTAGTYMITIGGAVGAWLNNGSFNAGTGTVLFNNGSTSHIVSIAGTTNFNNLSVGLNTFIQPATGSYIGIGGTLTDGSGSILDFTSTENTVEYNGSSAQTVINPIGNGGNIGYEDLAISGAGAKTFPATLNISGDFYNNQSAALAVTGTTIFTVRDIQDNAIEGTYPTTFENITLNNVYGLTMTQDVSVTGTLTVTNGVVASAGHLILKSGSTGTAHVAANTSGSTYISGDVTVERYIPANSTRAWRLLAVPTTTNQSINASWQNGQSSGTSGPAGSGCWITSNISGATGLGYDAQTPGNSINTYNASLNRWDGLTTSTGSTAIATDGGYYIYIRGDRSSTNGNSTITSTVLSTRGPLKLGTYPSTAIPVMAGKYELIGNPYPSAVDFTGLTRTGIDDAFYVWDPKLSGTYGLGAYVTLSAANGWAPIPSGGSYASATSLIESGQAFFVHSSGSTGSVQFPETAKASGSSMVFGPTSLISRLSTSLLAVPGNAASIADGNVVVFDNVYSNEVDAKDALKFSNSSENFGLLRNGTLLAIESRQPIANTDTLFFQMSGLRQRTYELVFVAENLAQPGLTGFLEDSYLGTSTPISLSDTTRVSITVDVNAGSSVGNRFRIIFKPVAVLPVSFTSIRAWQQGTHVQVEWKTDNELNIDHYEVEHSADGSIFSKIGTQTAANSGLAVTYNFTDLNPAIGDNFYRIKSIGIGGDSKSSRIVKLSINTGKPSITFYPNPVTDGNITLQFLNMLKGAYTIRLLNSMGQVLYSSQLNLSGGSAAQTVNIAATVSSGQYNLQIIKPDGNMVNEKIMVK